MTLLTGCGLARANYRCYPSPDRFQSFALEHQVQSAIARSNEELIPAPLSVSVSVPAMEAVAVAGYVRCVEREIEQNGALLDAGRRVTRVLLELATGAPFDPVQLGLLVRALEAQFCGELFAPRDYTLAAAPQSLRRPLLDECARRGFAHLVLLPSRLPAEPAGARDARQWRGVIGDAREAGFAIIEPYLPAGDDAGLLEVAVAAACERICIFDPAPPPGADVARERSRLHDAGYRELGMGTFVHPVDVLNGAAAAGALHYALHGFTAWPETAHLAFGAGALSAIGDAYFANVAAPGAYCRYIGIHAGTAATGLRLGTDDLLRRELIHRLIGAGCADLTGIAARYRIDVEHYFTRELEDLAALAGDGWIRVDGRSIKVLERFALPRICAVFDRHRRAPGSVASP
jgi:oxygen-independent coproporphyrinogen-3 oxidase